MWIRAVIFVFASCVGIHAATITASTNSRADVSNAVESAASGDLVLIPAGTVDWDSPVIINKSIQVGVSGTNVVIRDTTSSNSEIFKLYPPNGGVITLDGLIFKDGAVGTRGNNGLIQVIGTNTPSSKGQAVIKNCTFDNVDNQCVFWYGGWGVASSNYFLLKSGTYIANYVYADVSGSSMADYMWATNTTGIIGQDFGVIIEGNTFVRPDNYAIVDAYYGAVYTFRYNLVHKGWCEAHGTDSGGRRRGTRWMEVYGNTFVSNTYVANIRSGSAVIWGNTNWGYASLPLMQLESYRRFYTFSPWGQSDGTNQWDVNDSGNPFDTWTATSGSGTRTLVDNSKSWTVNQWAGYQLTRTNNLGVYNSSTILTNGPTLIWVADSGAYGTDISFSTGDKGQINKVTEALDQPGRSGGTIITGDPPSLPGGWNNQTDDPIYEWSNVGESFADIDFTTATPFIRAGEHYTNDTERVYSPLQYPHPLVASPTGTRGIPLRGIRLHP